MLTYQCFRFLSLQALREGVRDLARKHPLLLRFFYEGDLDRKSFRMYEEAMCAAFELAQHFPKNFDVFGGGISRLTDSFTDWIRLETGLRAGCVTHNRNKELLQHHPTCLHFPDVGGCVFGRFEVDAQADFVSLTLVRKYIHFSAWHDGSHPLSVEIDDMVSAVQGHLLSQGMYQPGDAFYLRRQAPAGNFVMHGPHAEDGTLYCTKMNFFSRSSPSFEITDSDFMNIVVNFRRHCSISVDLLCRQMGFSENDLRYVDRIRSQAERMGLPQADIWIQTRDYFAGRPNI